MIDSVFFLQFFFRYILMIYMDHVNSKLLYLPWFTQINLDFKILLWVFNDLKSSTHAFGNCLTRQFYEIRFYLKYIKHVLEFITVTFKYIEMKYISYQIAIWLTALTYDTCMNQLIFHVSKGLACHSGLSSRTSVSLASQHLGCEFESLTGQMHSTPILVD